MKKILTFIIIVILFVVGLLIGLKITNYSNEKTINQIEVSEKLPDVSYEIRGTYECDYDEDYVGSRFIFTFDNGKVTCYSDGTRYGKYEILGNRITIVFDSADNPDGGVIYDGFAKGPIYFTIIDEKTLLDDYGDRYIYKEEMN